MPMENLTGGLWDPFGTLHGALWIGGGQWAGKSTVARILALAYGLLPTTTTTTTPAGMRIAASRVGSGLASRRRPGPWGGLGDRHPRADGRRHPSRLPGPVQWALDDLRALVSGRPVIAEGWGLRPELVAPIIDSPTRMVVMVAAPESRIRQARKLPRAAAISHEVSDPDRAQRNRLARDERR